jgi:hypothetical protein
MSLPADSTGDERLRLLSPRSYSFRERGRVLGFDYDVGLRITTLTDGGIDPVRPPLVPETQRLLPPTESQVRVTYPADEVGRWESEGGACRELRSRPPA